MSAPAPAPTAAGMRQLVAQWRDWLAERTDTLLSLEERTRTAGSDDDMANVAAAFVARKAIAARLDAVEAALGKGAGAGAAAALAEQPVTDDLGSPVGSTLRDAADLLDAVLRKVEAEVGAREAGQVAAAERAAQAEADLSICRRLSADLGLNAGQTAALAAALAERRDDTAVAADLAGLRASLEAAERERTETLRRWDGLPARLAELAAQERTVRELAARCREKVLQAPPIAVPSVAAVAADLPAPADSTDDTEGPHSSEGAIASQGGRPVDLRSLPWPAARAAALPVLHRADRVQAALDEAGRRFEQPLQRREDLRGLLQSMADKATRRGLMAQPAVEAGYALAKEALWAAPCDLTASAKLVEAFVAAVNEHQGVAS